MRNLKGTLILLLTAFIWGTAFVAQSSVAGDIGTFTFNGMRSLVAAVFLFFVMVVRKLFTKKEGIPGVKTQEQKCAPWRKNPTLRGGIWCGIVLFVAMNFQQGGIDAYPMGVAASGRAGFLTATYVVFVAVITGFVGKKLHAQVWVAVAGCMLGMYFLCLSNGLSGIYRGDVLVFCCAICYTLYIFIIDGHGKADSIKMSCIQFAVCAVLSLAVALCVETIGIQMIRDTLFEILYTGVMSSGVAYTLQIVGQKYAEPAVASIVMSLESVFAVLAGWMILGERLSVRESWGCVLVFGAVILAQSAELVSWIKEELRKKNKNPVEK